MFLKVRWPNPSRHLTSLTNLLIKSDSDLNHYVCVPKLIKELTVNIFILCPDETEGVDLSPALFGQIWDVVHLLPNLTSFAILGCDAPTQLVQTMLSTAMPSLLKSLEIDVYGDDKKFFSVLEQLQHVTSLTLHMTNDPEFEHAIRGEWVHTVDDRVYMPLVSTIRWRTRFISPVPQAALALMAACCFARSCDLLLEVGFDGADWDTEDALLIKSIIKSYQPAQLTLEYFSRELLALLAPEIVQIPSVTIRHGPFATQLFTQDFFPRALHLFIDYSSPDMDAYGDFMSLIESADKIRYSSSARVDLLLDVSFDTWSPPMNSTLEHLIWEHVRNVVHRLQQRNIWVEVSYFSVNLTRRLALWESLKA